jgi:hypothetical protein
MDSALPTKQDLVLARRGRVVYHNVNAYRLLHGTKTCVPWSAIAAGDEEPWLAEPAKSIARWGYPIFMSFHHEPTVDRPHHPRCGTAAEYRAAFDHVVQVF